MLSISNLLESHNLPENVHESRYGPLRGHVKARRWRTHALVLFLLIQHRLLRNTNDMNWWTWKSIEIKRDDSVFIISNFLSPQSFPFYLDEEYALEGAEIIKKLSVKLPKTWGKESWSTYMSGQNPISWDSDWTPLHYLEHTEPLRVSNASRPQHAKAAR